MLLATSFEHRPILQIALVGKAWENGRRRQAKDATCGMVGEYLGKNIVSFPPLNYLEVRRCLLIYGY